MVWTSVGKRVVAVVACGGLALGAVACGGDDDSADSGTTESGAPAPLQAVASFYPLAEALQRIGGDRIEVTNLTPPGAEPHDIEVTSDDVDAIEDADLVVFLGGGFQPGIETAAERRDGPTLDVSAVITLEHADDDADDDGHDHADDHSDGHADDAHDHGDFDPHFWLDPTLLRGAVEAIATELGEASPADAATFAANAAAYARELDELDAEFTAGLADCARDQIVTAHAAFAYLAHRYGLEQLAITGLNPEAEADPQRLDELIDLVGEQGITTVFSETLLPADLAETLAREAGVTTAVLNPLEGLTKDQLAAGATYLSVQRENLAALQAALGCATS